MKRRAFMARGGALIVSFSLLPRLAGAQAAKLPGSLRNEPMLDAWIRIDADGRITVFTGKAELGQGIKTALVQVGLEGIGSKYPAEVSGGMRKRVAIARALVTEPQIVFFDEPTTGLDPVLVNTIHGLILALHRRLGFTAIMVSHEIPEIFGIADRVAMLYEGRIVAVGRPEEIQESDDRVVRQFIRGEPDPGGRL